MRVRKTAFTLIELLVVIAVIGLLVGMVIPSINQAGVIARRLRCKTNLHAAGVGFRMYLNESNEVMPIAAAMPSLGLNDEPRIVDVLEDYLSDPDTLKCPSDIRKRYYLSEGSSYMYHSMLGGRKVGDSFLTKHWGEAQTPVLYDYEPFHGRAGTPGAANYLFVDGHVGDLGTGQ